MNNPYDDKLKQILNKANNNNMQITSTNNTQINIPLPINCYSCMFLDPDNGTMGGRRPTCKLYHKIHNTCIDVDDSFNATNRNPQCPIKKNSTLIFI